jgi:cytochrome c oxidase subunit II
MNTDIDTSRRLLMGCVAALALVPVAALSLAKPKQRVIRVIAKKFEFVPRQIRVKRGEAVLLQFTAPEVPMGFSLADFGLRTDIVPGKTATLQLTPQKTGSFTFLCDVFCGNGHEEMSGTLLVS